MSESTASLRELQLPRRFLRFSLRTFLIVVTILAIWLGWHSRASLVQRRSVEGLGADFTFYSYQCPDAFPASPLPEPAVPAWLIRVVGRDFFYPVVYLNVNGAGMKSQQLLHLKGLPRLRNLGIDNGELNNPIAQAIGKMRQLEWLSMEMCGATDEDIRELVGLRRLTHAQLSFNQIDDEGLAYLCRLTNLRELSLQRNRITDVGLPHLAKLTNLESLVLSENPGITDQGVDRLCKLTSLRKLWIDKTKISDQGAERLRAALPHTTIDR